MSPIHLPDLSTYHSQSHLSLKSKPNFDFHPLYTRLSLSEREEILLNLGVDRATIAFWENLLRLDSSFGVELLIQKVGSLETSFRFFYDTLLIGIGQTEVLFSLSTDLFITKLREGSIPPYLEALLDFTPIDQQSIGWFLPLIEKHSVQQRLLKEAPEIMVLHLIRRERLGVGNYLGFESRESQILFFGKVFFKISFMEEAKELALTLKNSSSSKNSPFLNLCAPFFFWCLKGGEITKEHYVELVFILKQQGYTEVLKWLITTTPFIHFGVNQFAKFISIIEYIPDIEFLFFETLLERYNPTVLLNTPAIKAHIEQNTELTKLLIFKCLDHPGWSWESTIPRTLLTRYIQSLTSQQLLIFLSREDFLGKFAIFKYFIKSQIPKTTDAYKILTLNTFIINQPAHWHQPFAAILSADLEENFSKKYLQNPVILALLKKSKIEVRVELFQKVPHSLAFLLLATFHYHERLKLSNTIESHILPSNQMSSIALFTPILMVLKDLGACYDENQKSHLRKDYPAIYDWICQELRKGVSW